MPGVDASLTVDSDLGAAVSTVVDLSSLEPLLPDDSAADILTSFHLSAHMKKQDDDLGKI